MLKTIAVLGVALAMVSCQTQEVAELSYTQYRALAVQKNKECEAQGVKSGSEEMKTCVTHEMNREATIRQNENARSRAAAASTTYCHNYGYSITCF